MPPTLAPTVPASSSLPTLTQGEIASLLEARHSQPHALLGMHTIGDLKKDPFLVVRAFIPGAVGCSVLDSSGKAQFSLRCLHADGLFEGFSQQEPFPYQLKLDYPGGQRH